MRARRCSWPDVLLSLLLLLLFFWKERLLWTLAESAVLPAPQNLTVESYNFHNVLRWSPVQGISGTMSYKVQHKIKSETDWVTLNCKDSSKPECTFDHIKSYFRISLRVRAEQGNLTSPWTEKDFQALRDGIILPPRKIMVDSEGNSIHLSFLPPFDNGSSPFHYSVYFWEAPAGEKLVKYIKDTRYIFKNLKEKTEYCFQVNASYEKVKGQISNSYCAKTTLADATKIQIISLTLGFAAFILTVICLLVCFCKYGHKIKALSQPPLKIPAHYEEDLQNLQMIMATEYREFTEEHYDNVSVISITSVEQTTRTSFTSGHQPLPEVHS